MEDLLKADGKRDIRSLIDHTLLSPEAGEVDLIKLCEEAVQERFASICIHPYWVAPMARRFPHLRIGTVINFPLGLSLSPLHEAERAVLDGALELDIVVNPAKVKARDFASIEEELHSFRRIFPEITLKLILETCYRTDEEIVRLCQIASDACFDFVKTSTGFAREGATVHGVELMARSVRGGTRVKASGGLRSYRSVVAVLEAGASRLGVSGGMGLIAEQNAGGLEY